MSPAIHVRSVCTLKPSVGTWPNEDIVPINFDQDTCGPMARNIDDIDLLHRIATGIKDDDCSRPIRVGYVSK